MRRKLLGPLSKSSRKKNENKKSSLKSAKDESRKKDQETLPVVLIHGLAVPRQMLSVLGWRLRRYGRETHNLAFPILLHDIPTCAGIVARKLRELGIEECDVVTHSLGGVLLRWCWNNQKMPRIRRAVMISPPNQGSILAQRLHNRLGPVFPFFYGEAALQLRPGNKGLCKRAGSLSGVELGIIAGGSGTPKGVRNLFGIPGDNDGTVAVEETILPGMKDFVLINRNHSSILFARETAHMANLFLNFGVFRPTIPVELADDDSPQDDQDTEKEDTA